MSASALSKITLGRAVNPTGNSVVSSGITPLGEAVPIEDLYLVGEMGVCELSEEAGTFLPLLKRGVWQNLDGNSLATKGIVFNPLLLINPDCRIGILQTEHGPITKGYGDAQLAGIEDVTVRVEGAERQVCYIEPTLGIIILTQSIQPGSTVEVDYFYTPNPCLPMAEFNNFGYVFNQVDSSSSYAGPFPLTSVFGPEPVTPQPQWNGYTYTAFDALYSAAFNDPTSLLFNEPAHSLTIAPLRRELTPETLNFEGDVLPTSQGWEVVGSAPGAASFEEGLFLVEDLSTGTNVVDPEALFYRRDRDFTFDYIFTLNFRTKVFEYTKDGDYTGISAGWASDSLLYNISFLEVGSVRIVGMLGAGGDETNWRSYLGLEGIVTPRLEGLTSFNDRVVFPFEPGLFVGDEVFINGAVFEIASIEPQTVDPTLFDVVFTTEITSPPGAVQCFRTVDYTALTSYRVFKSENTTRVFTQGNPAPLISVTDEDLPQQEEMYDLLEENVVFFGGTSKIATSKSGWDFFRYSIQPVSASQTAPRVSTNGDFAVLPDEDPVSPWSLLDDQGSFQIVDGDFLNLEQAGRIDQGSLSYGRIEPLLTQKAKADLEARVRVDSWVGGSIPATITLADDLREVTLGLFADPAVTSTTDYATFQVTEGMIDQDANSLATEGIIAAVASSGVVVQYETSFSGTQDFASEGWDTTGFDDVVTSHVDHHQILSKPDGPFASATDTFPLVSASNVYTNYVLATRLRFDTFATDGMGRIPVLMGVDDTEFEVFVSFMDDVTLTGVVFTNKNGVVLADGLGDPLGFAFAWNDGEFHGYRLVRSLDVVSLFVDGVFLGSVTTADLQDSVATEHEVRLDLLEEEVTFAVDYFLSHSTQYATRQLGFYTGGDLNDPTSYEVVDAEFLGTFLDIRLTRNPAGKTQVFLNGAVDPVFEKQYSELPFKTSALELNTDLGYVRFGSLDPTSLAESVWDYVRYNVANDRDLQLALEHSVFNAAFPITSAEPLFDTTSEEVVLSTDTSTTLIFPSKGYNVRKVLGVSSPDGVTPYTFSFSELTQTLTLDNPQDNLRSDVLVRFLVKPPYSKQYLSKQETVLRLNEGTPPFELSQQKVLEQVEELVANANDFEDLADSEIDFTYEDGRLRISYTFAQDAFFNVLDLEQVDLGGTLQAHLSPACDDLGFRDLTLDGYADVYTVPDQAPDGFGSYDQPFYLDRATSTLDTAEDQLEPFSEADVVVSCVDFHEDAYGPVTDEALVNAPFAVLTFLGGFVLDSSGSTLDEASSLLDTLTETPVDIDYTVSVNFP